MRFMMSSSSSNEEERDIAISDDDVLLEIFSFLPADILIQFRIICKSWFNLITSNIRNPGFSEMHTQHQHQHPSHATITTSTIDNLPTILCTSTSTRPIPYHNLYSLNNNTTTSASSLSSYKNKKIEALEIVYPFKSPSSEVKILGSCNGLLCIQVTDYYNNDDYACTSNRKTGTVVLSLWNPTTTEFKQLPASPDELREVSSPDELREGNVYGFGFDRFINDYKLVKLMKFTEDNDDEIIIQVYTLGTNSWKRVSVKNNIPSVLLQLWSKMGLYVDGVLHWLGGRIYSFNIREEEFGVVPKPEFPEDVWFAGLQVLRGCLCIFRSYVDPNPNRIFEVWMMMDYGVKESWTKLFSVNIDLGWTRAGPWENLKPLWICNNGEVLIGSRGVQCSSRHLVIYDPNNNKIIKSIGIQGIPLNRIKEMVHIRSFVSLKTGTYVDQEQSKKNKKKRRINHLGIA